LKKTLVIGYGNTLRSDDAAGIRAAELIAKRFPSIECVCVHQLMPELAEQIAECDLVFFLDSQVDIKQIDARPIGVSTETDQPRTHFISPESLLSLSWQLYQHKPSKAYVIGIPATSFEFSEELSDITKHAVNECADLVIRMVENCSRGLCRRHPFG
jgi:hydrogenase maturation protease